MQPDFQHPELRAERSRSPVSIALEGRNALRPCVRPWVSGTEWGTEDRPSTTDCWGLFQT
jgi:hypothetical protein